MGALAVWWCVPLVVCAAVARAARLPTSLVIATQAMCLAVAFALVMYAFYLEPPDGQSALVVFPAPIAGLAAGSLFIAACWAARALRRSS